MCFALIFLALVATNSKDEPRPSTATFDALGDEAIEEVVLLAEDRPVFVRLRIAAGERAFRAAWGDSVRAFHALLDRDGDGNVKAEEADKETVVALLRVLAGEGATPPRGDLDIRPADGVLSLEELTEALRVTLAPFRAQVGRASVAGRRTDALFDHLDRNKDGELTRPELELIVGSLRRLDLDDNELIGADELEPFRGPDPATTDDPAARRNRPTAAVPPMVEWEPGDSPLRVVRTLVRKYDKGSPRTDGKLSKVEFAIDPKTFDGADRNGDGLLDTDELRRLLEKPPHDLTLDVTFSPDGSGAATARIVADRADPAPPPGGGGADPEFAVGDIRVDIHTNDGATPPNFQVLFKSADRNKDGYLEANELARDLGPGRPAPLRGLFGRIDRDGDGKVYPEELDDFGRKLAAVARGPIVLTVSDQGRSLFGILDRDRDRRLGSREILRAVDRLASWDADGDGRIKAGEIPYHLQITLSRGELPGLTAGNPAAGPPRPMGAMPASSPAPTRGPAWFRRMDRNRDGDVSRREFLGSRDQFDRLDRDRDGLIDPDEATAADGDGATPRDGPR